MKHLEGKTIYLIGTGNNKSKTFSAAKVLKVAKVFVQLNIGKYRMLPSKNEIAMDGVFSGYLYFETMQEADNHIIRRGLATRIAQAVRFAHDIEKLPFEKVTAIAELLGVRHEPLENKL